jgi:hypothetical protein
MLIDPGTWIKINITAEFTDDKWIAAVVDR